MCLIGEEICHFKWGGHGRHPEKVTSDNLKVMELALQTSGEGHSRQREQYVQMPWGKEESVQQQLRESERLEPEGQSKG